MADTRAKVALSSAVRPVASLPKGLVSHPLADCQGESISQDPLQSAVAVLGPVLISSDGFCRAH